ncbi:hypothetical protein, partial [Salmonella enterica]|uniref:hypothetical protein n=1 Tax=Salmonella enterica TaxID=28901 RepID=UPI0020C4B017
RRYSPIPSIPIYVRAARENRNESLHAELEQQSERIATLSYDVQKTQRLQQAFSRIIVRHHSVAFEDDPKAENRRLNRR